MVAKLNRDLSFQFHNILKVAIENQLAFFNFRLEQRFPDYGDGNVTENRYPKRFSSDPDFCSDCGTILPLPRANFAQVVCPVCDLAVNVEEFDGLEIRSEIVFSNDNSLSMSGTTRNKSEDTSQADGPLVDRRCPRCDNEGMTYATLQTRSADEGQTVFYTCPKCRFKEIENS